MIAQKTKVLVIGGGPAGSTVSTLLAKEGVDVTLIEKEVFPRYHIGESLLPSALTIFNLLGVREKIEKHGFTRKQGLYMEWGKERWRVDFQQLQGDATYSFQVQRDVFDQLLLNHAKECGVKVHEGVKVEAINFEEQRPTSASWVKETETENIRGEIKFDYVVDASGRAGLIANRYKKNRKFHSIFQNVAIWGYWKNYKQLPVIPSGAIANSSIPEGWLWAIPLSGGVMSIGLVIHKTALKKLRPKPLKDIYLEHIQSSPLMAEITAGADLVTDVWTEQDYSYASETFCGPGYFSCGDAACFLDPLLSSGVHLALLSGLLSAASLLSIIKDAVPEEKALSFYEKSYKKAYMRLLVFVATFYNQYNGKESYFWQANTLVNSDLYDYDLKYAFISLISGVEDLRDMRGKTNEYIFKEVAHSIKQRADLARKVENENKIDRNKLLDDLKNVNDKFISGLESVFPLDPSEAMDGLYISTEAGLSLKYVEQ